MVHQKGDNKYLRYIRPFYRRHMQGFKIILYKSRNLLHVTSFQSYKFGSYLSFNDEPLPLPPEGVLFAALFIVFTVLTVLTALVPVALFPALPAVPTVLDAPAGRPVPVVFLAALFIVLTVLGTVLVDTF